MQPSIFSKSYYLPHLIGMIFAIEFHQRWFIFFHLILYCFLLVLLKINLPLPKVAIVIASFGISFKFYIIF